MRIPREPFLDATCNTLFAAIAVAISLFVFAYSTIFGPPAILLFYACWLPLFLIEPRLLLSGAPRMLPLLILPAFAALSTLWSDQPSVTLRAAVQYGSTVFCGLLAARVVAVSSLAIGGLIGSIAILAYSFANGNYAYDVVDGSYAFTGAFDSKNQLGYFASLAIVFSVGVLWLFPHRWPWKLAALGVVAIALFALVISKSATSIITLAGVLVAVAVAQGLFALAPSQRRVAIWLALVSVVGLLTAAFWMGAFGELLAAFGKDTTLTGRTYLWREGIEAGNENPIVGMGYYAFWTHGRAHAEQLWREFYITARTGFHFHNTLIEAYVGLGLVGVVLIATLLLGLILLPMRVLLNRRRVGSATVCTALALLFAVRSLVEIDFFTPYTAGSFLVPYVLLQMQDQRTAEVRELRSAGAARYRSPVRSAA